MRELGNLPSQVELEYQILVCGNSDRFYTVPIISVQAKFTFKRETSLCG